MTALPPRLFVPAKLFFEAASAAKVPAILFGGAAMNLNGSPRETGVSIVFPGFVQLTVYNSPQDLDINVADLKIRKYLGSQFRHQPGSSNTRLRVTFVHDTDAIRCDVASDHAHILPTKLLQHTTVQQGICYALPRLLLVDKIRTYTQRSTNNDHKRAQDMSDILFCASAMADKGEKVPQELKDLYLNPGILRRFCEILDSGDEAILKDWLDEVGIMLE